MLEKSISHLSIFQLKTLLINIFLAVRVFPSLIFICCAVDGFTANDHKSVHTLPSIAKYWAIYQYRQLVHQAVDALITCSLSVVFILQRRCLLCALFCEIIAVWENLLWHANLRSPSLSRLSLTCDAQRERESGGPYCWDVYNYIILYITCFCSLLRERVH